MRLPAITEDLDELLPILDDVPDDVPDTFDRTSALARDVEVLVPETRTLLADANPTLGYIPPYGRDLGAMVASFAAIFEHKAENGLNVARLAPILNSGGIRGYPVPVHELDPSNWSNPYPGPGVAGETGPFEGAFPRVERAPR